MKQSDLNRAVASATGETGYVAPLYADLVAVTSQAMADLYQRHTPKKLNIVPFTIVAPQQSMRVPDRNAEALVAGIYLTALTDEGRLQQTVSELLQLPMIGSVFIRTHPAQVVNPDLSDIAGQDGPIEISNARPLPEDIARTDIAVCGNSTVAIEILRGGRPVLYDHQLDRIVFDYNGYAGHGLVLPYPEKLDEGIFDQIQRHFLSAEWLDKMSYFDSSYQKDGTSLLRRFEAAVARTLQQA